MSNLFDELDTSPRVSDIEKRMSRSTDPPTSSQAAHKLLASGELGDRQAASLDALRRHPGFTSDELEDADKVRDGTYRKRLAELRRLGLARVGEDRASRITGEQAQTWYPVE